MGIDRMMGPTTKCGCYHCERQFEFQQISEFWDEGATPVCPFCGIDSVLIECPDTAVTPETLNRVRRQQFGDAGW